MYNSHESFGHSMTQTITATGHPFCIHNVCRMLSIIAAGGCLVIALSIQGNCRRTKSHCHMRMGITVDAAMLKHAMRLQQVPLPACLSMNYCQEMC